MGTKRKSSILGSPMAILMRRRLDDAAHNRLHRSDRDPSATRPLKHENRRGVEVFVYLIALVVFLNTRQSIYIYLRCLFQNIPIHTHLLIYQLHCSPLRAGGAPVQTLARRPAPVASSCGSGVPPTAAEPENGRRLGSRLISPEHGNLIGKSECTNMSVYWNREHSKALPGVDNQSNLSEPNLRGGRCWGSVSLF